MTPILIVEVHNGVVTVENRVEMKSAKSESLWCMENHHMEGTCKAWTIRALGVFFKSFSFGPKNGFVCRPIILACVYGVSGVREPLTL